MYSGEDVGFTGSPTAPHPDHYINPKRPLLSLVAEWIHFTLLRSYHPLQNSKCTLFGAYELSN